ncbi:hypothetical protein CK203_092089 [Vitis vinifera]|uniref:Reverse transcriptase zinc-binding domain-containing protein n=1 Tax=Vitis vinifera TaxID=29760 RepID=A0A438CL75_VITVI|nr:hypothetical protein CK203_092089 [Vitis vinifera]
MPTEGVGKSNQKENSNRLRNIASRRREERGTLWKQVISRKYGVEEGGGVPEKGVGGKGVGCFEGGGGWNPRFSRPFNDWELETVERFLVTSQGKKVHTNMEDKVQWKEAKNGLFSVIAYCSTLAGSRIVPFPNSIIWSSCVSPKVGFFAWEASWGKVLALDELKKRSWSLRIDVSFVVLLKKPLITF